jgi:hypothetical protein
MSQPPNPARRSVLVGGLSFGAAAAASSPTVRSDSDPLTRDIIGAVKAHIAALENGARQIDHTPEHEAAEAAEDETLQRVSELAEVLFDRPVRSLADCIAYATIIEGFFDIPHEMDLAEETLVGDRAVGTLALRLLQHAGLPRLTEPLTEDEQDRRLNAALAADEAEDIDAWDSADLSPKGEAIRQFIDAMGGPVDVGKTFRLSVAAVSQWPERDYIPPAWHLRLWVEARKRNVAFDPVTLFGLSENDVITLFGQQPLAA